MGFVLEKMALQYNFLCVLHLSLKGINPLMLHTPPLIYHRYMMIRIAASLNITLTKSPLSFHYLRIGERKGIERKKERKTEKADLASESIQ